MESGSSQTYCASESTGGLVKAQVVGAVPHPEVLFQWVWGGAFQTSSLLLLQTSSLLLPLLMGSLLVWGSHFENL